MPGGGGSLSNWSAQSAVGGTEPSHFLIATKPGCETNVNFSTVTDDAIVANLRLSEHEADHTCWTKLGAADDLVRRGNVKRIYEKTRSIA
jgi:hypothetical protein